MIKANDIKISCPDNKYIFVSGLPGVMTRYPGNFYNLRLFYNGDAAYDLQFDDYMKLCCWLLNNYEEIETIGIGAYLSRCFGRQKQWVISMNFKEEEK
jgi:hypothetical protein